MKVILPAGGYATRMYPLTLDKPKALLEIGGKSIIDYCIDKVSYLEHNGILIVSNSKFYDKFIEWREKSDKKNIMTILSDGSRDESEKLGSVGNIHYALDREDINEDFLVVNPDNLFSFDLMDAYDYFKKVDRNVLGLMKLEDREEIKKRGSVRLNESGRILEFREKDTKAEFDICSVGIYFAKRNMRTYLKEYISDGYFRDRFGDFIDWLQKREELYGYLFNSNERILDVGSNEGYIKARDFWPGFQKLKK